MIVTNESNLVPVEKETAPKAKNIELIWKDTQFKPSKAVTLAHQLIHQHNVQYILGPCSSSATLAVAPIANTTKTLFFHPGTRPTTSTTLISHYLPYAD